MAIDWSQYTPIEETPKTEKPKARGLLEPGNIDLNTRPVVKNPDGSVSTVRSMSTNINGREVLIPTVSDDGRIMTNDEAIGTFKKTGKHLGIFESPETATEYARGLHKDQEKLYANQPAEKVDWSQFTPTEPIPAANPFKPATGLKVSPEVAKERGLLGDIASHLARGVEQGAGLLGGTLEMLEPGAVEAPDKAGLIGRTGRGLRKWAERPVQEKADIFKPDVSEAEQKEGYIKRKVMEGIESIPSSVLPTLGGAAVGAVAGGGLPGMIAGGLAGAATTAGVFGLGTYRQKKLEFDTKAPQLPEEQRHEMAKDYAIAEAVPELLSDVFGTMVFFGKPFVKPVIKGAMKPFVKAGAQEIEDIAAKEGIRELLRLTPKQFARNLAATYAIETGSETYTQKKQAEIDRLAYGGKEQSYLEALGEVFIPTAVMTLAFGLGSTGLDVYSKRKAIRDLNNEDASERISALRQVAGRIEDKEVRKAWLDYGVDAIKGNKPININEDFTKIRKAIPTENKGLDVGADVEAGLKTGLNESRSPIVTTEPAEQKPVGLRAPTVVPEGSEIDEEIGREMNKARGLAAEDPFAGMEAEPRPEPGVGLRTPDVVPSEGPVPEHIERALQKPRTVPISVGIQTKQLTKDTLNEHLAAGTVKASEPIRLTTVDELRSIAKKAGLTEGKDFEGRQGISAQLIGGEKPIVAYGDNDKISAAIIFPEDAVEGTGVQPNEVKIKPDVAVDKLRFVIDGYREILTFDDLKKVIEGKREEVEGATEQGKILSREEYDKGRLEEVNRLLGSNITTETLSRASMEAKVAETNAEEGKTPDAMFTGDKIYRVENGRRGSFTHELRHAIARALGLEDTLITMSEGGGRGWSLYENLKRFIPEAIKKGIADSGSKNGDNAEMAQSILDIYFKDKEGLRSIAPEIVKNLEDNGADKFAHLSKSYDQYKLAQQSEQDKSAAEAEAGGREQGGKVRVELEKAETPGPEEEHGAPQAEGLSAGELEIQQAEFDKWWYEQGYADRYSEIREQIEQITGKITDPGQKKKLSKEQKAQVSALWEEAEKIEDEARQAFLKKGVTAATIDKEAHEAATSPQNDLSEPTEGQREAGNYKKGHINIQGLDISIENPTGSIRSGIDKSGRKWESTLQDHYGYLKGTVGKDKDHIDAFIGKNPESGTVFVVNQIDPETRKFDEHKVMLAYSSEEEARAAYLRNYQKGWKGLGSIIPMSMKSFKAWIESGDTKKEAKPVTTGLPAPIPESGKINAITRETAGKMLADGDEAVLAHIADGVEKHGILKMQDAIRNQIQKELYEAKTEEERDQITDNYNKMKPLLDAILQGDIKPEQVREELARRRTKREAAGEGEAPEGLNPKEFQKGDHIRDIYSGAVYEVVESDKKGMAKLRVVKARTKETETGKGVGIEVGKVEDWNAYNNPHFRKLEQGEEKVAPKGLTRTIASFIKSGTKTITPQELKGLYEVKKGSLSEDQAKKRLEKAGIAVVAEKTVKPKALTKKNSYLSKDGYILWHVWFNSIDGYLDPDDQLIAEVFGKGGARESNPSLAFIRRQPGKASNIKYGLDQYAQMAHDEGLIPDADRNTLIRAMANRQYRPAGVAEEKVVEELEGRHAEKEAIDLLDALTKPLTEGTKRDIITGRTEEDEQAIHERIQREGYGSVAQAGAGALREAKEASRRSDEGRSRREVQLEEIAILKKWAENRGLMISPEGFTNRWEIENRRHGAEHQVILGDEWTPVYKRYILSPDESLTDYLFRIEQHNAEVSPGSPYDILGFSEVTDAHGTKRFMPVVRQVFVEGRQSTMEEIDKFFHSRGYEGDTGTYRNTAKGILVYDAGENNAITMDDGTVVVFDAKIERLKKEAVKPAEQVLTTQEASKEKPKKATQKDMFGTTPEGLEGSLPAKELEGFPLGEAAKESEARKTEEEEKERQGELPAMAYGDTTAKEGDTVAVKRWTGKDTEGKKTFDEIQGTVYQVLNDGQLYDVDFGEGPIRVRAENLRIVGKTKQEIKKESWQMTYAEAKATIEAAETGTAEEWKNNPIVQSLYPDAPLGRADITSLSRRHKESIRTALTEGKTVPEEVLRDYTDFAAKPVPEKPAQESRTEKIRKLVKAYMGDNPDIATALSGSTKASARAHIMSEIRGEKVSQLKSGMTALKTALFDLAGIDPKTTTVAEANERLATWIQGKTTPEVRGFEGKKKVPFDYIPQKELAKALDVLLGREDALNKADVIAHLATTLGIEKKAISDNIKAVEEALEAAVVRAARIITENEKLSDEEKWVAIKNLYAKQPALATRTSTSIKGQQYSTPVPIAYLMGKWTGGETIIDTTAGNGMLTIGHDPAKTTVNDLDTGSRLANLKAGGYKNVFNEDALKLLANHPDLKGAFDAVNLNPPFGSIETEKYKGFNISKLEHMIIVKSLEAMKDDGKAALIIGGHNFASMTGEERAMVESDRVFFNYLYSHYNVVGNIDIDGNVYKKMGTTYPIRLILIDGRKAAPNKTFAPANSSEVQSAKDFDELKKVVEIGAKKKILSTDTALRRFWELRSERVDEARGTDEELLKVIQNETVRADLLDIPVGPNPTIRLPLYLDLIRNNTLPFSEWYAKKKSKFRYRRHHIKTLLERIKQEPEIVKSGAKEYIAILGRMREALAGVENIKDAAEKYVALAKDDPEVASVMRHSEFRFAPDYWRISEMVKAENEKPSDKPKSPSERPSIKLDELQREGLPDYRNGKDVTGEDLKKTFGFASVTYGKYANQQMRQAHTNHAFDALHDLAKRLGLKPVDISLGRTLQLAIGALGHGKYSATYNHNYPHPEGGTVNVINLTRDRGDGTLAHEWTHALDYHLRSKGEKADELVSQIVRSLRKFYDYQRVEQYILGFFGGSYRYGGSMKKATELENAKYWLQRQKFDTGQDTVYYRNAQKLDKGKGAKPYWSNEREMLARAFEAWIYDTLDGSSPYLVNSFVEDGATKPPEYKGIPYPQGDERTNFNGLLDAMVEALEWGPGGATFKEGTSFARDANEWRAYIDKKLAEIDELYAQYLSQKKSAEIEAKRKKEEQKEKEARKEERDVPAPQDSTNVFTSMDDNAIDALIDEVIHEEFPETVNAEPISDAPQYPAHLLNDAMTTAQSRDDWATFWSEYAKLPTEDQQAIRQYAEENKGVALPPHPAPKVQGAERPTSPNRPILDEPKLGVVAKDFADAGIEIAKETLDGLYKLFGGGTIKSFPAGLDREAYEKAKPHFIAAYKATIKAGHSAKEFVRLLVKAFGERIKPYLSHFIKEVRDGIISLEEEPHELEGKVRGVGEELSGGARREQQERPGETVRRPESGGLSAEGSVGGRGGRSDIGGGAVTVPTERTGEHPELLPEQGGTEGGRAEGRTGGVGLPARDITDESGNELQSPYKPLSSGPSGDNLIPRFLAQATSEALSRVEKAVGNIDEYVTAKQGYGSVEKLHEHLSAEQIDALALVHYNFDNGAASIIADQTGTGKGRVAASIIRWANLNGKKAIFFTANPKLFSDMHRDLVDIGHDYRAFILHNDALRASIYSDDGKVIFRPDQKLNKALLRTLTSNDTEEWEKLNDRYDAFFINYHGVSKAGMFRTIVKELSKDNVVILDEAHLASGDSARGDFIKETIQNAPNVLYLSATYAKRPETMPLYFRTALGSAGMSINDLISAMDNGGVALQQIVAKILADDGQLVRRELDFSGVAFKTAVDQPNRERDYERADKCTAILREIVAFDRAKEPHIKKLNAEAVKEGAKVTGKKHTSAGVKSTSFTSVVHNYINQLLMAMKVDRAVEDALEILKSGEKPLINLMNTMEALTDWMVEKYGLSEGSTVSVGFNEVLKKALDGTLKATETDAQGNKRTVTIDPYEAGLGEQYDEIISLIDGLDIELPASPIDYIKAKIQKAGYNIGEITGRQWTIDYSNEKNPVLKRRTTKEINDRNAPVREFNHGELDAIIFNAAGSTGLSLHAAANTDKKVRHMIVMQADLNIDTFIQALGRIHRKGQVELPRYKLLMTALPAEIRPAAVLQKKLASLNANTSADTESAHTMKEIPNMINLYGDKVASQYLSERQDIAQMLGLSPDDGITKITGRVALAPAAIQEEFYKDIEDRYKEYIEHLDQIGENKLTAKSYDYRAESEKKILIFQGEDETKPFQASTYLERMKVNILKRPYPAKKVAEKVETALKGKDPSEFSKALAAKIFDLTEDYIAGFGERFKDPNVRRNQEQATRTARAAMVQQLNKFKIGTPYVVNVSPEYDVLGVLIDIRYADPAGRGNPTAGSRLKFTFAVVDPIQTISYSMTHKENLDATHEYQPPASMKIRQEGEQIFVQTPGAGYWEAQHLLQKMGATYDYNYNFILPASKLEELQKKAAEGNFAIAMEAAPNASLEDRLKAIDWDNQLAKDAKEMRHIVTGNVLRGVEIIKSQGEIITFTDKDGNLKTGILIPKSAKDIEKKFTTVSVGVEGVLERLKKTNYRYLNFNTSNGKIMLTYERDRLDIDVPRGKKSGGEYFLDEDLLKLVRGGNFGTLGKYMHGEVLGMENIKKALKVLHDKHGQKFVLEREKGEIDVSLQVGHRRLPELPERYAFLGKERSSRLVSDIARIVHQQFEEIRSALQRGIDPNAGEFVTSGSFDQQFTTTLRQMGFTDSEGRDILAITLTDKYLNTVAAEYGLRRVKGRRYGKGTMPTFALKEGEISSQIGESFYSQLEKTVEGFKQEKFSPVQLMGMLKGKVKEDELKQVGFNDFLAEQKGKITISKTDVLAYIEEKKARIVPVEFNNKRKELDERLTEIDRQLSEDDLTEKQRADLNAEYDRLHDEYERKYERTGLSIGADPKFSSHVIPGESIPGSYVEHFETVPEERIGEHDKFVKELESKYGRKYSDAGFWRELSNAEIEKLEDLERLKYKGWQDGHSSYDDVKNPIVRWRGDGRQTDDGKTFFIYEIQPPSKENQAKMPAWAIKRWREIGIKSAIRYAAENGYQSVSLATGEQVADLYDLSKQVDKVKVFRRATDESWVVSGEKGGISVVAHDVKTLPELEGVIGKELTKKATETLTEWENSGNPARIYSGVEYSGLDLKVGGEGIRKLYDSDLANILRKYGESIGGEFGKGIISEGSLSSLPEGLKADSRYRPVMVPSLTLTPALVDTVMGKGQPLFQADKAKSPVTQEDLAQQIARAYSILPKGSRIILKDNIAVSPDELGEALQKHGITEMDSTLVIKGLHRSFRTTLGNMASQIEFSMKHGDKTTIPHEVYHGVEEMLLSDRQIAVIERQFATVERRADAFSRYWNEQEGGKKAFLPKSAREVFRVIADHFRRLRNLFRGLGYQNAEDIFGEIYRGEVKGRRETSHYGYGVETPATVAETMGANLTELNRAEAEEVWPEVVSVIEGTLRLPARTIKTSGDAAAAFRDIAKKPQEALYALLLDSQNKPLSVHVHSQGVVQKTLASPNLLSGKALNEGAAKMFLIHNHPTGDSVLSKEDRMIFDALDNILRGTGLELIDMIAIGRETYHGINESGMLSTIGKKTSPVKVVGREFKTFGGGSPRFSFPDDAVKYIDAKALNKGLLFLDAKNTPVGFVSVKEPIRLRGQQQTDILKEAERRNAVQIILTDRKGQLDVGEIENVGGFGNAAGLKLLDAIDNDGSWVQRGIFAGTGSRFFLQTGKETPQSLADKILTEEKRFAQMVDAWQSGKISKDIPLVVSSTPEVLVRLGAKQLPIGISNDVLEKTLYARGIGEGKHAISIDNLKRLSRELHSPIMALASERRGRYAFVTGLKHEGENIIAIIEPDSKVGRYVINQIVTVHERGHGWIERQIENGYLRYYDKGKSFDWQRSIGLATAPKEMPSKAPVHRILSSDDIVKPSFGKGQTSLQISRTATARDIPPVSSAFEEVENRMKAARGLPMATIKDRMKAFTEKAVHSFTRHFPHLSSKTDGAEIDILRQVEGIPEYSKWKAAKDIARIVGQMKPNQNEVFTRILILRDMLKDIEGGLLGGELPFGYADADQIQHDLDRYEAIADTSPEITEALNARKEYMRDLRQQLVDADLLKPAVLEDDRYFHHQVLEYMAMRELGHQYVGVSSGDVRLHRKGWQIARKGSAKDFNTDYLQSEFEVISQGISQLEMKKALDAIDEKANIMDRLKRQAKLKNYVAIVGGQDNCDRLVKLRSEASEIRQQDSLDSGDRRRLREISEEIARLDPTQPYRTRILRSIKGLQNAIRKGEVQIPENFRDVVAIMDTLDDGTDIDFGGRLFEFMAHLMNNNLTGAPYAGGVFKAIAERNAFIRERLGRDFATFRTEMPDDYTVWQPETGNVFFRVFGMTERVASRFMEAAIERGVEAEAITEIMEQAGVNEVLAMGGPKEQWVIPTRLAKTMTDFRASKEESPVSRASKNILNSWKQWILLNPLRVVRYNINNLSGDLDIALAYSPRILKYAKKAAADLLVSQRGRESSELQAELEDAMKRGAISSGITVHEIPDITETGIFRVLTGKDVNLIRRWWRTTKEYTTWRENILRLAAYRYFKDELRKGKRPYGASKREEVDAVTNLDDRAAKLARELIGDYGNISEAGQWIRAHMIPFWSWSEINAPRYVRLFKNLKHEGRDTSGATGVMAWKASKLGLKAAALYALVMLWNATFFPDEEDELGREGRRQLHLILGRNEDGTIRSLRFQGALSDALNWFGLEDFPEDFKEVISGKVPWHKKFEEAYKAPVQRIVQGFRPIEKTGYELMTGKALYPDIYSPRPIRDRIEHALRSISMDMPYRYAIGRPSKGAGVEIEGVLTYRTDPGEMAYFDTLNKIRTFLKDRDYDVPDISPTPRTNALYWYKKAKQYGDKEAMEKYLQKYKDAGGKMRDIMRSVRKSDPLAFLPLKLRREFLDSLDAEDRKRFEDARRWWRKVYLERKE